MAHLGAEREVGRGSDKKFTALSLTAIARLGGHRMPRSLRTWGEFCAMGALNNLIPFTLVEDGSEFGMLRCHLARANPRKPVTINFGKSFDR